jgi:stage II sporulation protein D
MTTGVKNLLGGIVLLVAAPLSSCTDPEPPHSPQDAPEAHGSHTRDFIELPTTEPVIRVRLHREPARGAGIDLGVQGQQVNLESSGVSHKITAPVHIARSAQGWVVNGSSSRSRTYSSEHELVLNADAPLLLKQGDVSRRYTGTLHCVSLTGEHESAWELVEHIPVEAYLPGVLVGELYAGWSEACYAAQCVAARSFACMQIQQRARHHYDVTDGPSSQAYHGVVDRSDAHKAQKSTSGVVLAWKGTLVPGYFSSCCGGRAATATDGIGSSPINDIPPLMGHGDDDYCVNAPLYTWTIDRSARSLGRRIAAKARERSWKKSKALTTIVSIKVETRNIHGRPITLRLVDRQGAESVLPASDFFFAANFTGSGSGTKPTHPLWSGWAEGVSHRGRIELNGHGFGHGVGLCQYGAEAMGASGKQWTAILGWYYPGAELHHAW